MIISRARVPNLPLYCLAFLSLILLIYILWAIQPLSYDDWIGIEDRAPVTWPTSGQDVRYAFNRLLFLTDPISLFKPGSLLAAVFAVSMMWTAFRIENLSMRWLLTGIAVLGFPYYSVLAPWNLSAGDYVVAAIWAILWYFAYRAWMDDPDRSRWKLALFFMASFLMSVWHEVWLVGSSMLALYFMFESYCHRKSKPEFTRWLVTAIAFGTAYILAVLYYTHGGTEQFVDKRLNKPGTFHSLLTVSQIIESLMGGTKENIVLIKDCIPVFLLIAYLKSTKRVSTYLSRDFRLLAAASLGAFLFMYVVFFVAGAIHWRARWLCVFIVCTAFYAWPQSPENILKKLMLSKFTSAIRAFCLAVALVWFSWNIYFAYIHVNVDVMGWLQYRQMIVDHNPAVLDSICCTTLPPGRSKGVLIVLDHEWGVVDNRYRYLLGPNLDRAKKVIIDHWKAHPILGTAP